MTASSQLAFFIGKGGVGKTTVSAAYAAQLAAAKLREPVLLISTDPAHSLADVLQIPLSGSVKRIKAKGQLFAWQIDADKQFAKFLRGNREAILDVVEQGTLFSREEISPLLDTTLPGMAEVAALLALHDLLESGKYRHIVVDTAPMGHTLRLFELPEHFRRFLDFLHTAASRDQVLAATFGGTRAVPQHPFISKWQRMVGDVQEALNGEDSRLVLVTTPETFSLNEGARSAAILEQQTGLSITAVVLNRVVLSAGSGCRVCGGRVRLAASARKFLRRTFPDAALHIGENPGNPILGIAALQKFGAAIFHGKKADLTSAGPRVADITLAKVTWPPLATQLTFALGKGGVGKTTVSAGLAVAHATRQSKQSVLVCSTDPAPSLDDIFAAKVDDTPRPVTRDRRVHALEVDSVREYRSWAGQMRAKLDAAFSGQSGKLHVDMSFDRDVLAALLDVVPPGVDEIFSIFRILDLAPHSAGGGMRVVIDMAPTGHALELLRMPDRLLGWSRLLLKTLTPHRKLALAQEIAVEVASVGQRVRELAERLRDPKQATIVAVMLPEPLPDRETARLLRDLAELGIPARQVFVNRVIFKADAGDCVLCRRQRAWQLHTLRRLRESLDGDWYVVRNFPGEIAGEAALKRMTRELWRIG